MSTKRGTFLLLPILFSIIIPFNLAFSQDLTCTEIGSAVDMASAYALSVVDEPFNAGYCSPEAWYKFDLFWLLRFPHKL